MGQKEDKQKILDLVKTYTRTYHQNPSYKEGDYIAYAKRVYDEDEVSNLVDASLDFWLTSGRYTSEFEKKLGDYLNVPYVSFVNSGSSANLLAMSALMSPLLEDRQIVKGDEVITVAGGFPTTIAPIIQLGLVPVFVDIDIPTYNINTALLEKAYSSKTKAVFLAHTLGNPFDVKEVKDFCDRHHLWLIEDNCDALGSKYTLDHKTAYTGTVGDLGTSSFFPAHHITTGEGGAVYTSNSILHKIVRSLRDWGRDCVCLPGQDNSCQKRYEGDYGDLPHGYDHKYVYSHFGYNLKATDLQAAIGVAQLDKLDNFTQRRKENFQYLYQGFKDSGLDTYFILPEKEENADPSWFGFPLTTKEDVDCNDIVKYLENNNIQTRRLFAGNILKQPCFANVNENAYRVVGDLHNTDYIMEHTFWLGVYPGMQQEMLDYILKTILTYFK